MTDCYEGNYLERETGIEPATNSLGSCDSTTELLPLSPADMPSVTPSQNRLQSKGVLTWAMGRAALIDN